VAVPTNVPSLPSMMSSVLPSPGHQLTMSGGGGAQVGLGAAAQYLPPVFKGTPKACPPQAIISLPAQTAVRYLRPGGALMLLVALQVSVPGSYLPPGTAGMETPRPPQTIISLPVHTDASCARCSGTPVILVPVQLSVPGLYRPPLFNRLPLSPPQTIIWLVVLAHTAVCHMRPTGAFVVLVAVQLSVLGLYLPPVFKGPLPPLQTIISVPVHTAVC
jgi:hypothetical protein